jgi:bifunctional non-homologous end joining protein LigD
VTFVRGLARRPKDRVYVDWLQNVEGKTVVSPYSVREVRGAPVSTPLRWPELRRGLDAQRFTLGNFPKRLAREGDLWRPMLEDKQSLERASRRLERLVGERTLRTVKRAA